MEGKRGQECVLRFKVMVTRVQVMERWIKAPDEEAAVARIREELDQPYAYVGHWETRASEVEVVEVEEAKLVPPEVLDETGPTLLTLRAAADALGVPYSAVYNLARRGEIGCTLIGSRRYISREDLMKFVRASTRPGTAGD